ncbi:polyadenylate-binding protein-interacting protein 8-like [Brachypodium distachyon]|uniref:polyadenylate-binding protein-interacting protein 8-like n=1 Tax=Brachypodium distachyon TaxID=15368 RepID=UPI000D0DFAC5|nr:polyadenylate-binding protein-interacting protein 8-like [Brachypodium distachyon]|eukprot:XP_024310396.1 polyadenylate-binding protein-interacting protein 8-like [Brachypodium distachyon]
MAMDAPQPVSGLNPLAPQLVPAAAASRSKLNPLAAEFVPRWLRQDGRSSTAVAPVSAVTPAPVVVSDVGKNNADPTTRPRRPRRATEKDLVDLFRHCGAVVHCRLCRKPRSGFHFAFIEFQHHDDASAALHLKGLTIRNRPLKLEPSRTAIMEPVNQSYLSQEMSSRTVYCTKIEKRVTCAELVDFFKANFGSVSRVRLLGDDNHHVTGVAFVEFAEFVDIVSVPALA